MLKRTGGDISGNGEFTGGKDFGTLRLCCEGVGINPLPKIRDHKHYVYILTNKRGTLYVGYTGNIVRRMYEHKEKLVEGFAKRFNLDLLVYYEETSDVWAAREREKQIKGWVRRKKVALVEGTNPSWRDLSAGWFD